MNDIIIKTATAIGWLAYVVVALTLAALAIALVWRIIRHTWGTALVIEAIREHRENHPEKWKRFDSTELIG